MKKSELKELIKEIMSESDEPLYVEYVGEMTGENPFMLGGEKYQYVKAKYPDGRVDIGVYAFAGDVVYSYKAFNRMHDINEGNSINDDLPNKPELHKELISLKSELKNIRSYTRYGQTLSGSYVKDYNRMAEIAARIKEILILLKQKNENLKEGKMKRNQLKQIIKECIQEAIMGFIPSKVSEEQKLAMNNLQKQGYRFANWYAGDPDAEGESDVGVAVMIKKSGPSRMYKEVEPDGTINESVNEAFGDEPEEREYLRNIDRHNRQNPSRYPCPTCKKEDALSAWQKKQGYQCDSCANAEEGPMGMSDMYEGNQLNIDVDKLEDVEIEGIDMRDYPDFSDAYISSATYNGRELTEDELDNLNMSGDAGELINRLAHEKTQGRHGDVYDNMEENRRKLKKIIKECIKETINK